MSTEEKVSDQQEDSRSAWRNIERQLPGDKPPDWRVFDLEIEQQVKQFGTPDERRAAQRVVHYVQAMFAWCLSAGLSPSGLLTTLDEVRPEIAELLGVEKAKEDFVFGVPDEPQLVIKAANALDDANREWQRQRESFRHQHVLEILSRPSGSFSNLDVTVLYAETASAGTDTMELKKALRQNADPLS